MAVPPTAPAKVRPADPASRLRRLRLVPVCGLRRVSSFSSVIGFSLLVWGRLLSDRRRPISCCERCARQIGEISKRQFGVERRATLSVCVLFVTRLRLGRFGAPGSVQNLRRLRSLDDQLAPALAPLILSRFMASMPASAGARSALMETAGPQDTASIVRSD